MGAIHGREQVWVQEGEVAEHLAELIACAEDGKIVKILREGRVIAELIPSSEPKFDPEHAAEAMDKFLEERAKWPKVNVTREEILAWRHEGHRR